LYEFFPPRSLEILNPANGSTPDTSQTGEEDINYSARVRITD